MTITDLKIDSSTNKLSFTLTLDSGEALQEGNKFKLCSKPNASSSVGEGTMTLESGVYSFNGYVTNDGANVDITNNFWYLLIPYIQSVTSLEKYYAVYDTKQITDALTGCMKTVDTSCACKENLAYIYTFMRYKAITLAVATGNATEAKKYYDKYFKNISTTTTNCNCNG